MSTWRRGADGARGVQGTVATGNGEMNVPPDRIAFVSAGQVLAWNPRIRWLGMADLRMRVHPNMDVFGRPRLRERPSPGRDRGRPKPRYGS